MCTTAFRYATKAEFYRHDNTVLINEHLLSHLVKNARYATKNKISLRKRLHNDLAKKSSKANVILATPLFHNRYHASLCGSNLVIPHTVCLAHKVAIHVQLNTENKIFLWACDKATLH